MNCDISDLTCHSTGYTLSKREWAEISEGNMTDDHESVESNSLMGRLDVARHRPVRAADLASGWFDQTVRVRLGGAAHLSRSPELANHFRRSFGGALGAGASPEASDGLPCPWEPPCALDVFFREQMRVDGDGLPKPFVTLADRDGADLIAGLRVFGFATEWLPAVEQAFVDALRHRLPWRKLGAAPPPILDRQVETRHGFEAGPMPEAATLRWITPFDAEKIDAGEKTGSILTRLHRRLRGLARWHDADLPELNAKTVARWEAVTDARDIGAPKILASRSGLQRRTFHARAVQGRITLRGDLSPFWPLLLMGERCAVGRGAARGMGRYRLTW